MNIAVMRAFVEMRQFVMERTLQMHLDKIRERPGEHDYVHPELYLAKMAEINRLRSQVSDINKK